MSDVQKPGANAFSAIENFLASPQHNAVVDAFDKNEKIKEVAAEYSGVFGEIKKSQEIGRSRAGSARINNSASPKQFQNRKASLSPSATTGRNETVIMNV